MKPLMLTPEYEASVRADNARASKTGQVPSPESLPGQRAALLAEIDALRKLPVIRTCEDCAWGTVCSVPGTRRCYHPTQLSEAPQVTGAPPEWCPLRGE